MIFIVLSKFREKPTKENLAATDKIFSALREHGIEVLGFYWTLGRYDSVAIFDGPDEDAVQRVMKASMAVSEYVKPETLVALKREDAVRLVD